MTSTLVSPLTTELIARIVAGEPISRNAKREPALRIGIIPMRPRSSARLTSRRRISSGSTSCRLSPWMLRRTVTSSACDFLVRRSANQRAMAAMPPQVPNKFDTFPTNSSNVMLIDVIYFLELHIRLISSLCRIIFEMFADVLFS
jgi:hypothetical protein